MKTPFDQFYKLFFSEPLMVRDLLMAFFDADWVRALDFSTLQRLNTAYVTPALREKESDIVWKIQWKGNYLYILILIEFQSTVDAFMAVRMLSYISLLYQDIIKQDKEVRRSKQLPPVLPLVLYNGDKPWDAPRDFHTLLPPNLPKILRKYQPDFTYWLLDEAHCIIDTVGSENLMTPLIALEQSQQPKDILTTVQYLAKRLRGAEFDSLRRAYIVYLRRVLQTKKILPDEVFDELYEVEHMLSQRIDMWRQQAIEEGRAEGLAKGTAEGLAKGTAEGLAKGTAEGRAEGRVEGELLVLKRLLIKRFGSVTPEQILLIENKSADELLNMIDRIVDGDSLEEVIG